MTDMMSGARAEARTNFWASGHWPTLVAAFLYFDLAFMVWVILGPLAPAISADLGLSPAQKGLMVAVPTLAGALLRVVNGLLVDRIGPKRSGAISQVIVIAGLFSAWAMGVTSFTGTLALGVVLGFAGASFAIALPLASRWYPPEHQGKAMGLAGMGNSGTVLAALFAPGLAVMFGWNAVLGLACIPLTIVFFVYLFMAKDAPNGPAPKKLVHYFEPLKTADAWWLMAFYAVTFGGFVGLAASLPIYFTDQFHLTPVMAGYCTAACVFAGSLVRPMGGALADRIGGVKALMMVFVVAALALAGVPQADTPPSRHRLGDRDARARHRQRRGVPARPAALFGRDRGDDRAGRHGGRHRRFLPRLLARLCQAMERQLRAGLLYLRGTCRGCPGRFAVREEPVARDLRRRRRRADLVMTRTLILLLALAPAGAAHAQAVLSQRAAKRACVTRTSPRTAWPPTPTP